ncbi:MAG: hypothetical protein FWF51_00475 [Chitinivibrionia bacterium]|nr:hypothetical protein [Chitinivibrionia bacterium]
MKNILVKIVIAIAIIITLLVWTRPIKATFFDKKRIENELKAKTNEKDSLEKVLKGVIEDPNNLQRTVRNSGYSQKDETMLKIIVPDAEKETRNFEITFFLLVAATIVVLLVILFALPQKKNGDLCREQTTDTQE